MAVIPFARFFEPSVTFYDIREKEQIVVFLDTKIKIKDNERKWITTWNSDGIVRLSIENGGQLDAARIEMP